MGGQKTIIVDIAPIDDLTTLLSPELNQVIKNKNYILSAMNVRKSGESVAILMIADNQKGVDMISNILTAETQTGPDMSTFIDRLITEKKELDDKIDKLNTFISSENFGTIDPVQKPLLRLQASSMFTYSQILQERLTALTSPTEKPSEK